MKQNRKRTKLTSVGDEEEYMVGDSQMWMVLIKERSCMSKKCFVEVLHITPSLYMPTKISADKVESYHMLRCTHNIFSKITHSLFLISNTRQLSTASFDLLNSVRLCFKTKSLVSQKRLVLLSQLECY
jgi:hypothetical protein